MHHPLLHRHALPRPHFCARRGPATVALRTPRATSRTSPSSDAARPSTGVYLTKAVVHGDRTTVSTAAAAARDTAVGTTTPAAALSPTTNATKSMSEGDVVAGVVLAVNPVGAFVDLGGVTGLLHVSQISHEPFSAVCTVLAKGDRIKALVRFVDHSRGRIALSTKKLEPQPGDMLKDPKAVYERAEEMAERHRQERNKAVERKREDVARFAERFKEDDVVAGVVQSVERYGAFVDLGGVKGLLHASQISRKRVTSVEKVFAAGDNVKVLVLSIDRDGGRIELSTKELEPVPGDMLKNPKAVYERAEEMAAQYLQRRGKAPGSRKEKGLEAVTRAREAVATFAERHKVGDMVAGVVVVIKISNVFVDLGGVTGRLPVNQISHERVPSADAIFAVGDGVKALVLSIDCDGGRIKLSTKHLEPQPGDMLKDPKAVYERAEEMAERYREQRMQAEVAEAAEA